MESVVVPVQPSGRFRPLPGRTASSLTDSQRRLLRLMREMYFGRIEGLCIHNGEPVFDDEPPRVFQQFKFGANDGPRPREPSEDFCLKAQMVEFFDCLRTLGDAEVESLEIQHGLPFRMSVRRAVESLIP